MFSAGTVVCACGPAPGVSAARPAADAIVAYRAAINAKSPAQAYAQLSSVLRARISYKDFAASWEKTAAERASLGADLQGATASASAVAEQARVEFANGQALQVVREGSQWRLAQPLVSGLATTSPSDAVRALARAISDRDIDGALQTLTKRRRTAIARHVRGFVSGLGQHANEATVSEGEGRRVLRWEEAQVQYELVLLLEEGEWRIDDIVVRDGPPAESDDADDTD